MLYKGTMEYRRQLGTLDTVMIICGTVIGGGIFLSPPIVAKAAGSTALALAVWVLGGVITLAGGFCFAELGARMPVAGGSYVYLREAFGRAAAFVQGFSLLVVSGAGSVAAVASLCAMFIAGLVGAPDGAQPWIAVGAIAVLTAVNCLGLRPGANTQNALTTLKFGLLILVTGAGFKASGVAMEMPAAPTGPVNPLDVMAAFVPVIFAYNGWQVIGFVAGEIVDAPRSLPRAIVGSVLAITALYLAVNVAYVAGLGLAGLAAAKYPGPAVMQRAFGAVGGTLMTVGTVISTLGFVNSSILTMPRVLQAMAADGLFFRHFGELHPRWGTPAAAIVLQSLWACVLVFSGKAEELIAYVVIADGFFMGLSAAALFAIRGRETPEQTAAQAYLAPGYPVLPALYVLASVGIMASAVALSAQKALTGAGLIALALPLYLVWERGVVARRGA